jgi:hypothetical protein
MYRLDRQLRFEDFVFPYGKLDRENEWVKMADIMPWDRIEDMYAKKFVSNGHPAHPARMALGSLIIKQRLRCSDEQVIQHISENPYMQFFIGLKEYTSHCPFGESTMVAFRKRFTENELAQINEWILEARKKKPNGGEPPKSGGSSNKGTLILDATCVPADITYPQDLNLISQAREKAETLIDQIYAAAGGVKPRTYRKVAQREYLKVSKLRKKPAPVLRKGIRKQLNYLLRDIGYITDYVRGGVRLTPKQRETMNLITTVYEQQRSMYENQKHQMERRIVSLSQPYVRPIVRGKANANTEFGAKLHVSLEDGYGRVERLDFEAYNESEDLPKIVERFRERTGHYPKRLLADKIYRTRDNLSYCKEHGIRLSGPPLGRPRKDEPRDRKSEYRDNCERNAIEGFFGTGKRSYGLDVIMAKLQNTSVTVIMVGIMAMNLKRLVLLQFLWLLHRWPKMRPRLFLSAV